MTHKKRKLAAAVAALFGAIGLVAVIGSKGSDELLWVDIEEDGAGWRP